MRHSERRWAGGGGTWRAGGGALGALGRYRQAGRQGARAEGLAAVLPSLPKVGLSGFIGLLVVRGLSRLLSLSYPGAHNRLTSLVTREVEVRADGTGGLLA